MSSISKIEKKDGSLSYRVRIRKKGFPNTTKSFKSEDEAKNFIHKIESYSNNEIPIIHLPLRFYIDRYLQEKPGKCEHLLEYWKEMLGDKLATHIKPSEIELGLLCLHEKKTKHGTPLSEETIRKYRMALSAVYTKAINDWKWIKENPVQQIRSSFKTKRKDSPKENDVACENKHLMKFKKELKEKIKEYFPSDATSYYIATKLGTTKSTYNNIFHPNGGTTLSLLMKCLNSIGMTLKIVPIEKSSDL